MQCNHVLPFILVVALGVYIAAAADETCKGAKDNEELLDSPVSFLQEHTLSMRLQHSAAATNKQAQPAGMAPLAQSKQQMQDPEKAKTSKLAKDGAVREPNNTSKLAAPMEDVNGSNLSAAEGNDSVPEAESCTAKDIQMYLGNLFSGEAKELIEAAEKYKPSVSSDVFLLVLLIVSLILLFVGHKLTALCLFLIVFVAVTVFSFEFLVQKTDACTLPVYEAIGLGLLAGILDFYFFRLSSFACGALLGVIACFQFQAVLVGLAAELSEYYHMQIYYAVVVVAALIGGSLVEKEPDNLFAFATAVIGAFGLEICVRNALRDFKGYTMSDAFAVAMMAFFFVQGFLVQMCTMHILVKSEQGGVRA